MKLGGIVLFRDYAENDAAQLRFKEDRKIEDTLFVRQDGTLSYFFSESYIRHLFETCGFAPIECGVVHRKTLNIKEGIDSDRRFIQGRWRKIAEIEDKIRT